MRKLILDVAREILDGKFTANSYPHISFNSIYGKTENWMLNYQAKGILGFFGFYELQLICMPSDKTIPLTKKERKFLDDIYDQAFLWYDLNEKEKLNRKALNGQVSNSE